MRRDQLPEHKLPNYVMPAHRAAYVAVAKAACTSLKWLVAEVNGEDPAQFRQTVSRMVSHDMTIHQRRLWKRTPTLHSLDDDQLAEISPDNGWFVFTVVRHPSARLFSAWQSKLLLREPRWVRKHGKDPFFPRVPRSTEDVVEDFRRFALAMAADPAQPIMQDRHFMGQWREAAADRVPYTRIYDTAQIPQLLDDLGAHLRAHGHTGELRMRESNETPLKPIRAAFDDEVLEAMRVLYADDFDGLGYDDPMPPKLHAGDEYPRSAIAEVGRLVERHERIGELADAAMRLREQVNELKELTAASAAASRTSRPWFGSRSR